jgi:hypothetical protein
MNLGVLNGYAVNTSALAAWVKAATLAATLGASATASATHVYRVASTPFSAGASATTVGVRTTLGDATPSMGASGVVATYTVWAGVSSGSAGCSAVAFNYRLIAATALAAAGATGEALPDAKLGAVEGTLDCAGEACAIKVQFLAATPAAGASATARAQFGSPCLGSATVVGFAEASLQLSGETTWAHDGFVLAEAGCTATVAETHWQILTAGTVTPSTEAVATATGYKTQHAAATLSAGLADATVDFRNTVAGESSGNTAGASGTASVLYTHRPTVVASAGATGASVPVKMICDGRVAAALGCSGTVIGTRVRFGRATATAGLVAVSTTFATQHWAVSAMAAGGTGTGLAVSARTATATATLDCAGESAAALLQLATASASLDASGVAVGVANIEDLAPACRTLAVLDDRLLLVPSDDRTLIVGC